MASSSYSWSSVKKSQLTTTGHSCESSLYHIGPVSLDEFRKEIRCIKKFPVKHSLVFNRIVLERCLRCAKVYSFIAAFTGVPDREDCCLQLYHSQIKFWDIKCRVCSVTDVACLLNMNYFRSKQKEPNIKKFQVTCCVPQFFFPESTEDTCY